MVEATLKKVGFSSQEVAIYLDMLGNSPTSVRAIASRTGIGRGTVFNILKEFIAKGVASYHRRGRLKMFTAQDPQVIKKLLAQKQRQLNEQKHDLDNIIPELKSFYATGEQKPKVHYYEGTEEVSDMLRDVLLTMSTEKKKEYYVYSTKGKREIIYRNFPDFSAERIKAGIKVKVIAIGKGGQLRGLDERRWLSQKAAESSSYMVVYGHKISYVTYGGNGEPVGVIIEDKSSAETQKLIFNKLWESLPPYKSNF